jgi:putative nucleotidyltransferase with HDIG domain
MFFKAFTRLLRREPTPQLPASELLRDLTRVDTLPTLSDTTTRAISLTNEPTATLADLSELIRRDSVLTVAVLKLANSAAYGGRHPTQSVHTAISRLGMRGCRQVLAAAGVRWVFQNRAPQVAGACEALLRHALFTGALAVRLGAAGHFGFRGEEFTAGLLHDIGRVIVCARAPDDFTRADSLSFRESAGILAREREVLGIDHCEIGARFAEVNSLPRSVANAIRNHHTPAGEKDFQLLVALTTAADELANHVQCERKITTFRPEKCKGFQTLHDLVGRETMKDLQKAVHTSVVEAIRETRAMLRVTSG